MLGATFIYCNGECHYADYHYADCHYSECLVALWVCRISKFSPIFYEVLSKLACFELTCKDKDGYQQRSQKSLPRVTARLGDTN
jgi:hypothetical protein